MGIIGQGLKIGLLIIGRDDVIAAYHNALIVQNIDGPGDVFHRIRLIIFLKFMGTERLKSADCRDESGSGHFFDQLRIFHDRIGANIDHVGFFDAFFSNTVK